MGRVETARSRFSLGVVGEGVKPNDVCAVV